CGGESQRWVLALESRNQQLSTSSMTAATVSEPCTHSWIWRVTGSWSLTGSPRPELRLPSYVGPARSCALALRATGCERIDKGTREPRRDHHSGQDQRLRAW